MDVTPEFISAVQGELVTALDLRRKQEILPYLDREGISESASGSRFHPPGIASLP